MYTVSPAARSQSAKARSGRPSAPMTGDVRVDEEDATPALTPVVPLPNPEGAHFISALRSYLHGRAEVVLAEELPEAAPCDRGCCRCAKLAPLSKDVRAFYVRQDGLAEACLEATDREHRPPELDDAAEKAARRARAAEAHAARLRMDISFGANVLLLTLKVAIAVAVGSLAVVASALDSVLDLAAGGVLWWTSRSSRRSRDGDRLAYPVGRRRLEPIGIVVFSSAMATVSLFVIVEGARQLSGGSPDPGDPAPTASEVAALAGTLGAVVAVKFSLWLFCRGSADPAVTAYSSDHRNDTLSNAVGRVRLRGCGEGGGRERERQM